MIGRVDVDGLDPVIFVMSERYSIGRYLTSASETCAAAILAYAEKIKAADPNIAGVLVRDIEDYLARASDPDLLGTRGEYEANRERWRKVKEALT